MSPKKLGCCHGNVSDGDTSDGGHGCGQIIVVDRVVDQLMDWHNVLQLVRMAGNVSLFVWHHPSVGGFVLQPETRRLYEIRAVLFLLLLPRMCRSFAASS